MTAHPPLPSRMLWIVVLLLIGGYFRILAVQGTVVDSPIRADAADYYLSAYNLVHHAVYSRDRASVAEPPGQPVADAYRAPGVALLLAPFMSLWPDHETIIARFTTVNIVLGLGAIVAAFLAASAALPLPAAVAVGLLTATSPHLIALTVYVLSETPAVFIVALLLAVAAAGVPSGRRMRIVYFCGLGMIIGVLSLFRPAFIAFAPVLALAFPDRRDKLHALLFGCLGAALVVAPWMIRNALNVPPGGASLLASGLLDGSYPGFMFNGDKSTFPYGSQFDPAYKPLTTSVAAAARAVLGKIAADPVGMMLWYVVQKPVYLLQWSNIDGAGDVFVYPVAATPFRTNNLFAAVHDVHQAGHVLLLFLAIVGAIGVWWSKMAQSVSADKLHVLRMASLLLAFLYLIHLPFAVNTRYTTPVLAAMYLLAVFVFIYPVRVLLTPLLRARRAPQPIAATPRLQPARAASGKKKRRRTPGRPA